MCFAPPLWIQAPTLAPALIFGGATLVLPWVILLPALEAGLASRKAPHPWQSRALGLATHIVFGVGLYLCAKAVTSKSTTDSLLLAGNSLPPGLPHDPLLSFAAP
jgi:hypothetical protein